MTMQVGYDFFHAKETMMSKMAPDPRDERIAQLEMECAKMAEEIVELERKRRDAESELARKSLLFNSMMAECDHRGEMLDTLIRSLRLTADSMEQKLYKHPRAARSVDDESKMRAAVMELADEFEKSAHISVFEDDTDAYIGIQYRVAHILRDLARKD